MNYKRINIYPIVAIFAVLCSTCITPFTPQGIEIEEGTVVIEGDIIVQGNTKVYISLLRSLEINRAPIKYITEALVWVESNGGQIYNGSLVSDANVTPFFLIDTKELSFDQLYKLCVSLPDGRRYESDFLTPFRTPEIEAIDFLVNDSKTAVDFFVTTYGAEPDQNSSQYYKWHYTEDWEIYAVHNTRVYFDINTIAVADFETSPNPYYYCWKKSQSSSIMIAKTDHLKDNIVYQQKISSVDYRDDRISSLYFMDLSQMSISKEAYLYWLNLKKITDEIGGIFAPQPSEMFGNIRCISHPDTKVIGYLSAGTVTSKTLFVPEQELGIYAPPKCELVTLEDFRLLTPYGLYLAGFRVVSTLLAHNINIYTVTWGSEDCVDCRSKGTKNKPSFWPNDHF